MALQTDQAVQSNDGNDEVTRLWGDISTNEQVIAPWQLCTLLEGYNGNEDGEAGARVVFVDRTMDLPFSKLASYKPPKKIHHNGLRVLAPRRTVDLPYTINVANRVVPLYAGKDTELYPGIIAVQNAHSCMVFFDDGHVQNVTQKDVRLILGSSGLEHGKHLECIQLLTLSI